MRSVLHRIGVALALFALVGALAVASAGAKPAKAPYVAGASALGPTSVKVTFDKRIDPAALDAMQVEITPSLEVTGVSAVDDGYGLMVTTATQDDATLYTLQVTAGIRLERTSAAFIGAADPAFTVVQDDFNRPSGYATTDLPRPGPWTWALQDGGRLRSITSPAMQGASLYANVWGLDGQHDNAYVSYGTGAQDELFASAYAYIPSGQGWTPEVQVGLLRFSESEFTAHARLTAVGDTESTYGLMVNWKQDGGYHGDTLIASGIAYDTWHWLQLRVKNGAAGSGVIQVWVDGALIYEQNVFEVREIPMYRAEVGIMHLVSAGPAARVVFDQARLGLGYQPVSVLADTTPPTDVVVTEPASGTTFEGGFATAATATDDVSVQRVEFVLDGDVMATDDIAPYAAVIDASSYATGDHGLVARAYDTSGNITDSDPVTVTLDNDPPGLEATVAPEPFSPNGDGYDDLSLIDFTTFEATDQQVTVVDDQGTLVRWLRNTVASAAGPRSLSWSGTLADGSPAPDGAYFVRIRITDPDDGRVTEHDYPATVNRVLYGLARNRTYFSPNGDGLADTTVVSYTLLGPAIAGVVIEDLGGGHVRTLEAPAAKDAGEYTGIAWDGLDDGGTVVPDGTYRIRATAVNEVGSVSMTRTVTVDTVAPTITTPIVTPNPWQPTLGVLTVMFSVDSAGSATVDYVLGSTVVKRQSLSIGGPGIVTTTWDGLTTEGSPAVAGDYTVKVYFADRAGNRPALYPATAGFTLLQ
jgi:flagellar hook assembly protein FlgD